MTAVSGSGARSIDLRLAHATWLRTKAAHFRRLARGAVPFDVTQDLDRLAIKYERLAAALEDGAHGRSPAAADVGD